MTLQDLIALFRADVNDATEPYLWSDEQAIEFANDAQIEACRRARLIIDSSTPDVAVVPVVAGTAAVALVPEILFIRRARLVGQVPLQRRTLRDMDLLNPFWQDAQPGIPKVFITDADSGAIQLWPTPVANGTLQLTAVRIPLAEMNDELDTPEIAPRWHRSLRYWMAYRAYSMQDSEANDPKKAADSLALFEQEFGRKSSAIDEAWIEREMIDMDGTY